MYDSARKNPSRGETVRLVTMALWVAAMVFVLAWFLLGDPITEGGSADERGKIFALGSLGLSFPAGLFIGPLLLEGSELVAGRRLAETWSAFVFWLGCFCAGAFQWWYFVGGVVRRIAFLR